MKKIDIIRLKSLEALIYKTVRITTKSGDVIQGEVSSYTRADDTDDGIEYAGIERADYTECFDKTMIKTIEIEDDEEIPAVYFKERNEKSYNRTARGGYIEPVSPIYASGK